MRYTFVTLGIAAGLVAAACAGSTERPANDPTTTTTSGHTPSNRDDDPARGPGYGGTTSYGDTSLNFGSGRAAARADGGTLNHDQNGGDIRTDSISR